MLISGAATYYTTSLPDRMTSDSMTDNDSTDWMASAKAAGWAMAGAYYRDLVGGGATKQMSVKAVQKFTSDFPNTDKRYAPDSNSALSFVYKELFK